MEIDMSELCKHHFHYEKSEYVCEECKGINWIANQYWDNKCRTWEDDPSCLYWCHDCEGEVDIIEMEEDDE
jgi:DNA-directed RNA polymerase subunit RPC12/RpoP|tara:strand:+ start:64 stop:276 length:213 start_codon:yes stop_codon:yes gene_type:complete